MMGLRWLVWLIFSLMLATTVSCKGYREFREARKELKEEKAARKEQQQQKEDAAADEVQSEEIHFPDSLFFAMQRTPCFGRCPTYTVQIFESGYALYYGESNVERVGEYEAKVEEWIIDSIRHKAGQIGFMMLLDSYDNSLVTDLPSTLFKLNIGGQKKEVKCRVDCPERLFDFADEIEQLTNQIYWTRQEN